MGKIKAIVIFGAGYVLGARAGHRRYEQIKNWAQEMWGKPIVQEQIDKAGDQAAKLAGQAAREAKEHLPEFMGGPSEGHDSATDPDSGAPAYPRNPVKAAPVPEDLDPADDSATPKADKNG